MRIYVAGPYTQGDSVLNLRNALEAAEEIAAQGHAPYVPHLTMFWHLVFPHGNQHWYEHDLAWLDVCQAIVRLPGPSYGADREVERAVELGLMVYTSAEQVPPAWMDSKSAP